MHAWDVKIEPIPGTLIGRYRAAERSRKRPCIALVDVRSYQFQSGRPLFTVQRFAVYRDGWDVSPASGPATWTTGRIPRGTIIQSARG